MKEVQFKGALDAKIYLIGESPGVQEELDGRPFVGGSGKVLDRLLMDAGIDRAKCRIGNLAKVRPVHNDFAWFRQSPENEEWLFKGMKELNTDLCLVQPTVIVPLGNEPMKFLLGQTGILRRRGSIYWSDHYECKVVPTVHPASIMRNWDVRPLVLFDLKRVKEESLTKGYDVPERRMLLNPTFERTLAELDRLTRVRRVAFDIETSKDTLEDGRVVMSMSCIGFADTALNATVIPFQFKDGTARFSAAEEVAVLQKIKELLESPVEKVAQNAQFDMGYLKHYFGMDVNNFVLDTMCAQHTLYPELKKGLDVLCSIFTKQPYYKDWAKLAKSDKLFWEYNGMDACITFEVAERIEEDMKEFGVWDFYHKIVHPLIPILLDMQLLGVRIDEKVRLKALCDTDKEIEELQEKVNDLAGVIHLNVNSPKQMKELLYVTLGLPSKINRKTGKVSTDEDAIEELDVLYPNPLFKKILKIRKLRKLKSTYLEAPMLEGRMHTSYNIGGRIDRDDIISAPETGRLSSSQSIILHSGTNLQNIPKGDCRRMYIPDEGKVLVRVDLSQAEARVVACLAGEEKLIKAFSNGGDVFRQVAGWIFDKPSTTVSAEEREIAKRMVHALNYGMGPHTFKAFAKIPYAKAKQMIERYFETFPKLKVWHLTVESELKKSALMTTPMGRKRMFFGRWSQALLREAYAYVPQSTVGDLLNYAMIQTNGVLKGCGIDAQMLLQVHDEFVLQCLPKDVEEVCNVIRRAFDINLIVGKCELIIPIKISTGHNWEEMEEVK